jgi:hypothetical protein
MPWSDRVLAVTVCYRQFFRRSERDNPAPCGIEIAVSS